MRADNTEYLRTAARRRHENTRAEAIAALHGLDQAGARITFESVADHAGISRSWLYDQTGDDEWEDDNWWEIPLSNVPNVCDSIARRQVAALRRSGAGSTVELTANTWVYSDSTVSLWRIDIPVTFDR
ncbi:hypothetical protein ACIRRA_28375 [Nocardia sp. NPDC101769]|uniref:hypothetical protein n=1 Tax=Nocardia sp. NPDC101769 TaxID=3364333 RepID=UPI00380ADA94